MEDAEASARIEALEGRVVALMSAIRALIAAHHAPGLAEKALSLSLDQVSGLALGSKLPDGVVDALSQAEGQLIPDPALFAQVRRLAAGVPPVSSRSD